MRGLAVGLVLAAFAGCSSNPSSGGTTAQGGSSGATGSRGAGTSGSTGTSGTSASGTSSSGTSRAGSTGGSSGAGGSSGGCGPTGCQGGSSGSPGGTLSTNGGSSGASSSSSGGGPCSEPDDSPCAIGSGYGLCCAGLCADLLLDSSNCGACYNGCLPGQSCSQGQCLSQNCDGAPPGTACAGNAGSQDPSESCVGGVCALTSCAGASGAGNACALAGGLGDCCGGACTSGQIDPANCGSCGIACAIGATCSQGQCSASCQGSDGGSDCPTGTVCAQSIYSGQVRICLSASCSGLPDGQLCATSGGGPGQCCGQSCLDMNSDSANCGSCGNQCFESICAWGTCENVYDCASSPPGALCLEGDGGAGSCCGSCVNLDVQTDPLNCGGCGVSCPAGASCVSGGCVLDGGPAYCGQGSSCASGFGCVQSQCLRSSCDPSTAMEPCATGAGAKGACCGSACVNLDQDSANCGSCGNACPGGTFCSQAACAPVPTCGVANSGTACPLSPTRVGTCCSGSCVDLESDPSNCQGCGVACPAGEVCQASSYGCAPPDGGYTPGCQGIPGACPAGTLCWGNGCLTTACAPGASGVACAFGVLDRGTCCGGSCVDTSQDSANCGQCGSACSGLCAAPMPGLPARCLEADGGGCPLGCMQGQLCVGGSCQQAGCQGPGGTCAASDGNLGVCCFVDFSVMCSDLSTDSQNCGGCGVVCPVGQSCANGVCSGDLAPCGAGRNEAYCDLDAGTSLVCCPGGGCTNLEIDSANCGYCDYGCQAGLSCVAGSCVALSCSSGTAGATCAAADGGQGECCGNSCLDVASDPSHCGGCATQCASGESCLQGACGFDQCSAALQGDPCHLDAGAYLVQGECCNSACADTQDDPANCGGCNLACPGDGGCKQGVCQ
ncbi:MAG: hypothetical protein ACYDCL_05270 [Myxococcales bacterium]